MAARITCINSLVDCTAPAGVGLRSSMNAKSVISLVGIVAYSSLPCSLCPDLFAFLECKPVMLGQMLRHQSRAELHKGQQQLVDARALAVGCSTLMLTDSIQAFASSVRPRLNVMQACSFLLIYISVLPVPA